MTPVVTAWFVTSALPVEKLVNWPVVPLTLKSPLILPPVICALAELKFVACKVVKLALVINALPVLKFVAYAVVKYPVLPLIGEPVIVPAVRLFVTLAPSAVRLPTATLA